MQNQGAPHPYEEWNVLKSTSQINNISKYLREKQKLKDLKDNFLSIFSPKNTGPIQLQSVYESKDAAQNNDDAQQDMQTSK